MTISICIVTILSIFVNTFQQVSLQLRYNRIKRLTLTTKCLS